MLLIGKTEKMKENVQEEMAAVVGRAIHSGKIKVEVEEERRSQVLVNAVVGAGALDRAEAKASVVAKAARLAVPGKSKRECVHSGKIKLKVEEKRESEVTGIGDLDKPAAKESVIAKAGRLAVPGNSKRARRWTRKAGKIRYASDFGSIDLRVFHRRKLRKLLKALMRQHQWSKAAGVISILLGIKYTDDKGSLSDFGAALEVLGKVSGPQVNSLKFRRLYRILTRKQLNVRRRGVVQADLGLYLLNQGDHDGAYNEFRVLADSENFCDNSAVNLFHGLNLFCLWHEKAVLEIGILETEETRLKGWCGDLALFEDTGETSARQNDSFSDKNSEMRGSRTDTAGCALSLDRSDNKRAVFRKHDEGLDAVTSSPSKDNFTSPLKHPTQDRFYEDADEQVSGSADGKFWDSAMIISAPNLDLRLFPVRLFPLFQEQYLVPMGTERSRELHAGAVKYLKRALEIEPDLVPALLPLVQLLLAAGNVRGAKEEIDKCCRVSDHIAPFCIKVVLLESLNRKDPRMLATAYQNVLRRDPADASFLRSLIRLHYRGGCTTKSILLFIAMHLDVDKGDVSIWQDLLHFLQKVSIRLMQQNGTAGDSECTAVSGFASRGLEKGLALLQFLQTIWHSRHTWWLTKHFAADAIASEEQQDGDSWRVTYKAACAAHIYGPDVAYAREVLALLENKQQDHRLLKKLQLHCDASLKLFPCKVYV